MAAAALAAAAVLGCVGAALDPHPPHPQIRATPSRRGSRFRACCRRGRCTRVRWMQWCRWVGGCTATGSGCARGKWRGAHTTTAMQQLSPSPPRRQVARKEGLRAFYRGFGAVVVRAARTLAHTLPASQKAGTTCGPNPPHLMDRWATCPPTWPTLVAMSWASTSRQVGARAGKASPACQPRWGARAGRHPPPQCWRAGPGMLSGMSSGAVAQLAGSLLFTPVDIIKERMQVRRTRPAPPPVASATPAAGSRARVHLHTQAVPAGLTCRCKASWPSSCPTRGRGMRSDHW